jgi:hypothetical protein
MIIQVRNYKTIIKQENKGNVSIIWKTWLM